MAKIDERVAQNVPGKFYVDASCIYCDLCVETAPKVFREFKESGWAYVFAQPVTEEEVKAAMEAVECCPTESIGYDGEKLRSRSVVTFRKMKRFVLVLAGVLMVGFLMWRLLVSSARDGKDQERTAALVVHQVLHTPLQAFRDHVGRYPTTDEGLSALLAAPKSVEERWLGPYVEHKIPADPWDRPYNYRSPAVKSSKGYDLWSLGPDPSRDHDDIGNWRP
jgi:type II secretion system protein G